MTTTTFDPTAPLDPAPDPWESTSQPSHRDGPPYHLTDMIAAEPELAVRILGRLADPQPTRLVALDGRGVRVDVSPDQAWALVIDRVDNVRLVRVADGRAWSVDRERILVWDAPG